MDTLTIPNYNEEFVFEHISQKEYFYYALKAVENLLWGVLSSDNYTIVCHTPGGGASSGESVTIIVHPDTLSFHSHSVNEYEIADNPNIGNAAAFKTEVAAVSVQSRALADNSRRFSRNTFAAIIPSKTYLITPILIYLNVAVFVVMVMCGVSALAPDTVSLAQWGANFRPLTLTGGWWRLVTSMFLHAGILHLLLNMYALLYIGTFLERLIGKFRFAAAYLFSGIAGSLASLMMHPATVSVGASGAIFGMYGVFFSLLTTDHIEKNARNTLLRSIGIFILLNLVNGVKGNIDNACHVGGLISGLIIGYVYYPGIRAKADISKQLLTTAFIAVATVLTTFAVLHTVTNDYVIYENNMTKFANMEMMALEIFKNKQDRTKEDLLYDLNDRGMYYWNECIQVLRANERLSISEPLRAKNKMMEEYCRLRIKMFTTLADQVTATGKMENSPEVQEEMTEVEQLMKKIKDTK